MRLPAPLLPVCMWVLTAVSGFAAEPPAPLLVTEADVGPAWPAPLPALTKPSPGITPASGPVLPLPSSPYPAPTVSAKTETRFDSSELPCRRTAFVELIERVRPSVVNIHSERTLHAGDDSFSHSASNRVNGMGTGIVIDPRGYIITNQHVVDDVQVLRVRLHDGTSHAARVIGRDPVNDLALLKIEPNKPLPMMPLGTANDLMVGEDVIAIGNAYGYEHTVSRGIVSAINRDVTLNKDVSYKALIQTDAAINPGNSGGPLINAQGELVGVNVAIRAGAQNIGFAIRTDTMIRVAAEMLGARRRGGAWHGLTVSDRVDGTSPTRRSLVVEKADSAAGNLKKGDVVTKVGSVEVKTSLDLERAILDKKAGDQVPIEFTRSGSPMTSTLTLLPGDRPLTGSELVWRKLGLRLSPAHSQQVTRVNSQLRGGLTVNEVQAESVGAKAGLQRGDVLIGLHQWETLTLDNVTFVLNHPDLNTFNPMRFYLIRNGQIRRGWLPQID